MLVAVGLASKTLYTVDDPFKVVTELRSRTSSAASVTRLIAGMYTVALGCGNCCPKAPTRMLLQHKKIR